MLNAELVSLKLVSGEEIVCQVVDVVDDSYTSIIIKDPLKVEYKKSRSSKDMVYSLVPWILFSNTREFQISASKILSVSKIDNNTLEEEYFSHFRILLEPGEDFKDLLERIYRDYNINKSVE